MFKCAKKFPKHKCKKQHAKFRNLKSSKICYNFLEFSVNFNRVHLQKWNKIQKYKNTPQNFLLVNAYSKLKAMIVLKELNRQEVGDLKSKDSIPASQFIMYIRVCVHFQIAIIFLEMLPTFRSTRTEFSDVILIRIHHLL